jgi:hypothetical protein
VLRAYLILTEAFMSKIPEENRDPITGAPGAHPVGTGVGAAAGGVAAGAAVGSVAGPEGTMIGAAAGAIAEEAYWRENYERQPYYESGMTYDDYGPAYRLGYESRARYAGGRFEDVENDLATDYQARRGRSRLSWERAKQAARAAWDRVERALPGDFDKDGR